MGPLGQSNGRRAVYREGGRLGRGRQEREGLWDVCWGRGRDEGEGAGIGGGGGGQGRGKGGGPGHLDLAG